MTVLRILRKDWTLLRRFVVALAVLQLLLAAARFGAGHLLNGFPTVPAALLQLLAVGLVMTLLVHEDPVPGIRQDWLIRPIPPRDVFFAKLLFAVVLVQGPWWLTDALQGVANGFSVGESLTAASTSALRILMTVTLPMLAFAALTATMTDAFVAALGAFAIVVAFLALPRRLGMNAPPTAGFAWVGTAARDLVLLIGAVGVLILQYGWRWTLGARWLFAGAFVLAQCVSLASSRTSVEIAQLLSASGADDESTIALAFDRGAGRLRLRPGQALDDVIEKPGFGPADVAAESQRRRREGARTIFLPLRFSGLTPGWRVLADRADVRVRDGNGATLYSGFADDIELLAVGTDATVHQAVRIPGAVYGRIKREALAIEFEYALTVFRADTTYAIRAQDGDERMPDIGWCITQVNDAGTHVRFRCLRPGERPSCLAVALEHVPTHARNPEVSLCVPDYAPYPGHTMPDALSRFGGNVPFFDPSGSIRYRVSGPDLAAAQLVVTKYHAAAHFRKRIALPVLRLEEWEPLPPRADSLVRLAHTIPLNW